MGQLAAVGGFRVKSEQTLVPSQSVIGEKSLATTLQWTSGNGGRLPVSKRRDRCSQSKCDW